MHKKEEIRLRLSPAWLVSKEDNNIYNQRTKSILREFEQLDIPVGRGNVIFPSGNAKKYLSEYFDAETEYVNRTRKILRILGQFLLILMVTS